MAGKVAGLNFDQAGQGPGGSIRVTLRGESSIDLNNNGALFVIDGVPMFNTSSGMGESAYAIDYGNGTGDINPDEASTVWDMGKTYYWCGMTLVRRSDSYVTDLRAGYVELSDDGENWTKAQDFDFGDKTNTSTTGTYAVEQWTVSGRYVRLAVNASNRNKLYSVSEFVPVLAEKTK